MTRFLTSRRRASILAGSALLSLFVFLLYSNTFHAAWHLDDFNVIVTNPQIQMESVTWQGLADAWHGGPQGKVWRPVAFISFALNWAAGGSDVFGYHLVNIFIHLVCTVLLAATIRQLFHTPVLRGSEAEKTYFAALVAAALWAVHPIQTQAVTYIVQRMALLAAMFYLAGIFCYLKGRLAGSLLRKAGWFLATAISIVLALGSKEHSITFPLTVLLLEAVFFQSAAEHHRRKILGLAMLGGAALFILGSVLFLNVNPQKILDSYQELSYTPLQRLLTELRVLVFYLSQVVFPIPRRFSIDHDFALSRGLLDPWTTLPAILICTGLVIIGIWLRRRHPLASFGILFFFLTHMVESSIVPLELVFEHRNYLPTLFLFLPVSAGLYSVLQRYRRHRTGADMISAVFLGVVLCGLGYATHVRNSVWITEKSLWTDAHRKAPQLSRPLHNLAWGHYDRSGRLREAMLLYMRALEKKTHRKYERAITYDNIAAIYYELGYYPDAVVYWQKALSVLPEHNEYRYRTALALFGQRRWESALIQVEQILDDSPGNVDYLLLKGRILLQQGRNWAALKHFQTCLGRMPRSPTVAICCGMALEALGANINAAVLYRYAISLQSDNLEARMRLAGVQVQRGIKYEALIRNMTLNHPLSEIQKVLHLLDFSAVPDERTYVQLVDVIDLQFQALFHDLP